MKGDTNLHRAMIEVVATSVGRCLWCEKPDTILDADGLCDMCQNADRAQDLAIEAAHESAKSAILVAEAHGRYVVLDDAEVAHCSDTVAADLIAHGLNQLQLTEGKVDVIIERLRTDRRAAALARLAELSLEAGGYADTPDRSGEADKTTEIGLAEGESGLPEGSSR